jgi:hypothetical protein
MITPLVVREVKRLLAEGSYSQRKIARMTGVSRTTVRVIASGKRRDRDTPAREPRMGLDKPTGPPRRCPGCGGLVYMPCRLCHVRELIAESRVAPRGPRPEGRPQLELSGNEQARCEQVRFRQIRAGQRSAGV